jgi:hypothetical protein
MTSMNLTNLSQFLVAANTAGYASAGTKVSDEDNGSHTILYEADGWRFEDNFFGGEPYGGREVISCDGRVEWMMLYYGWVGKTEVSNNDVYRFLRHALMRVPEDAPYRGPDSYVENYLEYQNRVDGGLDNFSGEEVILDKGEEIYRARYFGGLVDQRPGD